MLDFEIPRFLMKCLFRSPHDEDQALLEGALQQLAKFQSFRGCRLPAVKKDKIRIQPVDQPGLA